jgi:hypothetical protein
VSGERLDENAKDYTHSSLRESIIEQLFVGKILQELWKRDCFEVEVLKSQVDSAGYDLAIDLSAMQKGGPPVVRHVQLKSSNDGGSRDSVNVSLRLAEKPNPCVIWIVVDKELEFKSFRWFEFESRQNFFDNFKIAKHTKADSTGKKAQRPGHRVVPKTKFKHLATIKDVVDRLLSDSGT